MFNIFKYVQDNIDDSGIELDVDHIISLQSNNNENENISDEFVASIVDSAYAKNMSSLYEYMKDSGKK